MATTTVVEEQGEVTVVALGARGERATVVEIDAELGLVRVRRLRLVAGGWTATSVATHEDPAPLDPDDLPAALSAPLPLLRAA